MSEETKEVLKKIKDYIKEGAKEACIWFSSDAAILHGKISTYNDIYDYIVYEIEIDDNNV